MRDTKANREKIRQVLESQKWTFAKTMANIPHEWVYIRSFRSKDISMVDIAKFIKKYGYVEYFYGKPYTYMNFGNYKYWTMDYPLEKTDLINRCKLDTK